MYKITDGKVEYGQANSIVKKIFYLSKGQLEARELAGKLREITKNSSKFEEVIKYIENNGFEVEPKIITRQSNKGYQLSEAVNLNLKESEIELVEQIKKLSNKKQKEIIESGGLSNIEGLITSNFSKVQKDEKISKERYYAEAIFSMYDWKKIGIDEFSITERENLIQRIQNKNCVEIYKELEQQGIERDNIPTVLLNKITGKKDKLEEELSIERVERFLGYYDVKNTRIQLRPYQQRATEKTDEILENNRFASLILPTGGGKSFVGIDQLMKHQNEKIIYFAPQNEILEQMKDYIIKYIHGPKNTLGKSKVLCKNVLGFIKNNKEQYIEHQGLQGFSQNHEPIYLNLFNLSNIELLAKPSKYKEVMVMENPTVFMEVSEKCNKKDFPFVCTYGQVKLSGLILLDMFVKQKYKIYYSGDLDPEGIQIADKLKQRYKNNLNFFGFDVSTYNQNLSNVNLSEIRLKKLEGIKSLELLEICDKMKTVKKASYEEENIKNIIKFINSKYNK